MRNWVSGLVLFVAILVAAFVGGCTTAQMQSTSANIEAVTTVSSAMLEGVYASLDSYCSSGQISKASCNNLDVGYQAARSAIILLKTFSAMDNSTSYLAASTQATAAIMSAYFDIAAAIQTARGGD